MLYALCTRHDCSPFPLDRAETAKRSARRGNCVSTLPEHQGSYHMNTRKIHTTARVNVHLFTTTPPVYRPRPTTPTPHPLHSNWSSSPHLSNPPFINHLTLPRAPRSLLPPPPRVPYKWLRNRILLHRHHAALPSGLNHWQCKWLRSQWWGCAA